MKFYKTTTLVYHVPKQVDALFNWCASQKMQSRRCCTDEKRTRYLCALSDKCLQLHRPAYI